MSNTPSTPVKVPPSAANHSAATLDTDLRSQINTLLLKDGHIQKIQEALLHSLHSNSANWPTLVQNHAVNLLRSEDDDIHTYPALLSRVLEDVRTDAQARPYPSPTASSSATTNGTSAADKDKDKEKDKDKDKKGGATNGVSSSGTSTPAPGAAGQAADQNASLAIPPAVVDEMLKVVRESLETVCEIEGAGAS